MKRVDVVRKTLQDLPEENYQVLCLLTAFLVQVSTSLNISLTLITLRGADIQPVWSIPGRLKAPQAGGRTTK